MQKLVFAILGLIFAAAVGFAIFEQRKGPPPEHGGTTADRLTPLQQERLVERPMRLVARGDLAGGQRQFELEYAAMIARKGERSIVIGDMLSAFGGGLWVENHEAEAVPYFRRAVAAYRNAVGPDDPEVALALHTVADAIYADSREPPAPPPPPEVLEAMQEALRIRRAALGPNNAETAVTYVRLGRLNGHPALTHGDAMRIEAAAQQARHGLELLPSCPNADATDIHLARRTVAEIYARNGWSQKTIDAVAAYRKGDDGLNWGNIEELADMLAAAGDAQGAKTLRERFKPD